jgi:hypothetical protein
LIAAALAVSPPCRAGAAPEAVLPPVIAWDGQSRALAVDPGHPWATPAEHSGLTRTPRYAETVEWLRRLVDAAPGLEMVSIGTSPEGRDIWMVVAARGGGFTPEALRRSGKPTLLAHAGIHAGEIDGKDAGMMLLRDMTVGGTRTGLLDGANFLFVPIFNVDGHERFSRFSRMNQRGPVESGWRATSRRLNLNRDYSKLDTPEMRAMVRALDRYDPDLYLDLHVTDGMDYQYDITFGFEGTHAGSPAIATWLETILAPALDRDLQAMGHIPGPLIWPFDPDEPDSGLARWTGSPRYSTGYGNARHLPTVLVENHSLKPFDQRVLGTYVLLESALRTLAEEGDLLRRAVNEDRNRRSSKVVLDWEYEKRASQILDFLAIDWKRVPSYTIGKPILEWTGEPVTLEIPRFHKTIPAASVKPPRAYWIPPAWTEVIERLEIHGIALERIDAPARKTVEIYRILEPELDENPFEGHVRVAAEYSRKVAEWDFPAGSVRVPVDQPLGELAVLLLEPRSPDSFFQWGFFLETLQQVEYAEEYVIGPMADRMLKEDPKLDREFRRKLAADPGFAADPAARRQWFFERTPYFDPGHRLYPVAREP